MEPGAILPLDTLDATLGMAGGKGANLAALVRAGFPVPKGLLISTLGYTTFVEANALGEFALATAAAVDGADPDALEGASARIRERFEAGAMPEPLAREIRGAYTALGAPPVAVRSSATAEDLPEMSFAGQQDTFLNVVGVEALFAAVVRCWSSLWTARAIGYRARNGLAHDGVALAVVVQEMVESEASGVLFTANPLTGKRTETVVDATLGLGEALVSGLVEPDHYVLDAGRIVARTVGAKATAIEPVAGGGTRQVAIGASGRAALPDEAVLELARMGERVESLFGAPQDVEWAWADGRLLLLQSRPITSLYPVPAGLRPQPLRVLVSFGAIQGMLAPITPLGRDFIRQLGAALAGRFGFDETHETQRLFRVAGERLFIDTTPIVRHPGARRLFRKALSNIEPGIAGALGAIFGEHAFAPVRSRVRLGTVVAVTGFAARIAWGLLRALARPRSAHERAQWAIDAFVASIRDRTASATTLGERVALLMALPTEMIASLVVRLVPTIAMGIVGLGILDWLATDVPGGRRLALEATRGLPHNVTTEMDLALWDVARAVLHDPDSSLRFAVADTKALAAEAFAGQLPPAAQAAVDGFLERYGMRGVAEIDLGRLRWREDPTPLIDALLSYLRIDDEASAPDAVFQRGAASARESLRLLAESVRRTRFGWMKVPLVRWAAFRMRTLAGLRESPKFTVVRALGLLREGLLESGLEMVEAGALDRADDLFFLHVEELETHAAGAGRDWRPVVAERRAAFDREMMRRQVPRVLLSDGRALYGGAGPADETANGALVGSPVSPGSVDGLVRVVHDPREARLEPGEILVCPGTDPAWTPLFLAAGGLVTEVGGLMTHGSVVAREYGIPAVVGVAGATTRLRTGQRVRVDGSTGRVVVLEDTVP